MNNLNIIEINFQGNDYLSIGSYMDSNEGILGLFPNNYTKPEWYEYLNNSNLLIQIWSLGFLLNEYCDDEKNFIINYSLEFYNIISENKAKIKKWYNDNGISLDIFFLNFIYGTYSAYGQYSMPVNIDTGDEKQNAKPGDDLLFEDESIIKFYNKKSSWDDINDNVFIEKKYFDEFKTDLKEIRDFFLRY
jgi:hypothetical protein